MQADRTLVGDIGSTNVRLAMASDRRFIWHGSVAGHANLAEAIRAFLKERSGPEPLAACLAVAGPVIEGACTFTNSGWRVDRRELAAAFGWEAVQLVNDFEALAFALPHLGPSDLIAIGGGAAVAGAPMLVIGPGSGLGMACLVPSPDGHRAIASEGGHMTLPAHDSQEEAVIAVLRQRYGHVSAERVLSGPGLVDLYAVLGGILGRDVPERDAAAIAAAALDGSCVHCIATLDTFCAVLGGVAGDMALVAGAQGGVFIAGGIVPRLHRYLARSAFRERFEGKGRLRSYLTAIPTHVVIRPDPAMLGLAMLAREPVRSTDRA
jgi:glucokinase